jgi:hypothetical protein
VIGDNANSSVGVKWFAGRQGRRAGVGGAGCGCQLGTKTNSLTKHAISKSGLAHDFTSTQAWRSKRT